MTFLNGHCGGKLQKKKRNNMNRMFLPAEWHRQSFIQLTWPHENTDWAYMLDEVEECFINIAREILRFEPLLIVAPDTKTVKGKLENAGVNIKNLYLFECSTNDTWARDHSFITLVDDNNNITLTDFLFNGWGMKYIANLDNQINHKLFNSGILKGNYQKHLDFVLEGGSIESDGKGILLTTSECLLSPNRNEMKSRKDIEDYLKSVFNLKKVLWINNGYLAGDDTDSHVDTLARMCPDNTIVYVKCNNKNDEHYEALKKMEDEIKSFVNLEGNKFRILPLPFPDSIYDEDGERLPATYANFLIVNNAVLYPTYNQPDKDKEAKNILQDAFPKYEIVGIDCNALIKQHGSLHCVTMQFPEGVLIR